MKYAIISEGIVVNTVVADAEFAQENGWILIDNNNKHVGVGCSYDGNVFSMPPVDEEKELEEDWQRIREKRDKLLASSDLYMFPDRYNSFTSEQQQQLTDYRQSLRGIPQAYTDPSDGVWPSLPC